MLKPSVSRNVEHYVEYEEGVGGGVALNITIHKKCQSVLECLVLSCLCMIINYTHFCSLQFPAQGGSKALFMSSSFTQAGKLVLTLKPNSLS